MKNSKLIMMAFIHSLGTAVYVLAVAWFLFNGERWFGKADNFFMPFALLLLLVLSASITGLLVLGRPIYLYFDGFKKEAVKLLGLTVCWLAIFTFIVFIVLLVR